MACLHFVMLVATCLAAVQGDHHDPYPDPYPHPYPDKPQCSNGFRDSGYGHCIDVDECTRGRIIKCGVNADCYNTKGSFRCICRPGFHKPYGHNYCIDIDECHKGKDLCTKNENCVNLVGSYNCLCKAGYVRSTKDWQCRQPEVRTRLGYKRDFPSPYHPLPPKNPYDKMDSDESKESGDKHPHHPYPSGP